MRRTDIAMLADNPRETHPLARIDHREVTVVVGQSMVIPPPSSVAMDSRTQSDHSRAVLTIETPVCVTLARKKVSLERIINLVPGSMLTFDAHCDEPLLLEVGGQSIAKGETVKIGDKFGLRIREIIGKPHDK